MDEFQRALRAPMAKGFRRILRRRVKEITDRLTLPGDAEFIADLNQERTFLQDFLKYYQPARQRAAGKAADRAHG
jgi:hypothetical protein